MILLIGDVLLNLTLGTDGALLFVFIIFAIFGCDLEWKTLPLIYERHMTGIKRCAKWWAVQGLFSSKPEKLLRGLRRRKVEGEAERSKPKIYNSLLCKKIYNNLESVIFIEVTDSVPRRKKKKQLFNSEHVLGRVVKIKRNFSLMSFNMNCSASLPIFFCHAILS